MSKKYIVTGPDRAAQGLAFYGCASRLWPPTPVIVEIIEGSEEPTIEVKNSDGGLRKIIESWPNRKGTQDEPVRMTAASFAKLNKQGVPLIVKAVGDGGTEENISVDVLKTVAENERLTKANAELIDKVKFQAKKIEDLEALLAEATKPAAPEPTVFRKKGKA